MNDERIEPIDAMGVLIRQDDNAIARRLDRDMLRELGIRPEQEIVQIFPADIAAGAK